MGLHYHRMGAGPTVLLIHGAVSCSRAWEPQMRFLAHLGFSSVAVDLPGHGSSPRPCTIENAVVGIRELLPKLNPIAIVGYSYGCVVAIEAIREYPVPGLVLVCPAVAIPQPTRYFYDWVMGWPLDWMVQARPLLKPLVPSPMGRLSLDENPAAIRELWPLLRAWTGDLTHLTMPVWVAGGYFDHIAPPPTLTHFTAQLPQGHLTFFWGRHRPMESAPQQFNDWLGQSVDSTLEQVKAAN